MGHFSSAFVCSFALPFAENSSKWTHTFDVLQRTISWIFGRKRKSNKKSKWCNDKCWKVKNYSIYSDIVSVGNAFKIVKCTTYKLYQTWLFFNRPPNGSIMMIEWNTAESDREGISSNCTKWIPSSASDESEKCKKCPSWLWIVFRSNFRNRISMQTVTNFSDWCKLVDTMHLEI